LNVGTSVIPTVGEALVEFRRASGLRADEASHGSWSCRLGPVAVRLPNFAWRRRAILAHDLHHLLTGYPCTLRGEFQMAAWEFGAGPMPHWGATLFCLPLVLVGICWAPRRMLLAFLGGRRSRSLHESGATDRLLASPLCGVRRGFAVPTTISWHRPDYACFAVLILKASLLSLSPVGILAAMWIVLYAA
jgi:hypothetical protein